MKRIAAFVVLFSSLLVGCGASTRSLTADPVDYELYRRTRTAQTAERRLSASFAYLEQMPEGRWRPEVDAWFARAERAYFEWAKQRRSRLQRYLDTLPRGPHATLAAERIAELELSVRLQKRRDARILEEALGVEEKLADAEALRRAVVGNFADWTRRLAGIKTWGQPTSELGSELIFHYRMEDPRARCADERCNKSLQLPFAIPDSGRLATRKALLDVELTLFRGGVVKARLAGPELFNRVSEASEVRPVRPDDAQGRAEAIARAVQIVEGALPPELSSVACRREAVSPVVLARECDGLRVTMVAATSADVDDELVIEPLPAP